MEAWRLEPSEGRLDPGETWQDAARREITEETGCEVRLGRFAAAKLSLDRPQPKLVLYWLARVVRDDLVVAETRSTRSLGFPAARR